MTRKDEQAAKTDVKSFADFTKKAHYSLMDSLRADPESTVDGYDHNPRQVRSGHYVPVRPTAIATPKYVGHSSAFFNELGLSDGLAQEDAFIRLFSGDISVAEAPMRAYGWATGYALSIYGTEYDQQCPFQTGNGYGDGRAVSIFEGSFKGQRWEMQLKGGGRTPYCRGADGRAVLRSSVREFLAQEFMHALGVPTSRSLTLYMSQSETVQRPWYVENSRSYNPDVLVSNPVAITTRVAPSFLRVGQLELFARRVRRQSHPDALLELKMIVEHLIERNYRDEIAPDLPFNEQVILLAERFRGRLIDLVVNWLRVGYCQGNFNSDNCAAGGFTLDYGPFGFCELFDPRFQPWTGGGDHFSFFNQPAAAHANFQMFWRSVRPLLADDERAAARLDQVGEGFASAMEQALEAMWARKLGMRTIDTTLLKELLQLMVQTKVDYTIFFRALSYVPEDLASLRKSFYQPTSTDIDTRWQDWLERWRGSVLSEGDAQQISEDMRRTNPSITWREWLVAPAYKEATLGENHLVHELQGVFSAPYNELPANLAPKYDRLKPTEFFNAGGVSHYSCSS